MASWIKFKSRITASVRTTSRMNALVNETAKKKPIIMKTKYISDNNNNNLDDHNQNDDDNDDNCKKTKIIYFNKNLSMDHIYKLIAEIIDTRFQWDSLNRIYDPWRIPQFVKSLSDEIKDRIKELKYQRHRIVCIISIIEKQQQCIDYKMMHLMDPKFDNFTNYVHERGTYSIIATVWLVYKD